MRAIHVLLAGTAVAIATVAQAAIFGGFAPRQDYPTGSGSNEVVVADFNGDGVLDLATANRNGASISVLLGNGDGTFGAGVTYAVGNLALTIEAADLDGDGDIDITVANGNDLSISVLFGNGDGTFVTHQTYVFDPDAPPYPGVIMGHTMADFDGDGDVDIALITLTASLVLIMPNDGTGTFNSYQVVDEITGFTFPVDLETGDLDGDGDADLIMEYGSSTMRVYLNNGNATFVRPPDFAMVGHDIMTPLADLNGDGILDIALNNTVNPGGYISVVFGNGDGTFGPVTTYNVDRPSGITSADFDGDGYIDLAVTSYATFNTVSVMLGKGDGTFADPLPFATAANPECPVAADFDGDSWPDLVTANRGGNSVSILINLTCPGDLDGDHVAGLADLAILLGNYGMAGMTYADGDLNDDGVVNLQDLAELLGYYGVPC